MNIYSYLESVKPDDYIGIDALTITCTDSIAMLGIVGAMKELEEAIETEMIKPFKFNGATGFSKGPLRYAERINNYGKRVWAILMVTGPLSQNCLKYLHFGGKATRIDLRVDVAMSSRCMDLAERYYKLGGGTLSKMKFISSLTGQTLYPSNDREGTYFGRLYDKSPEYGEELGWVWRYEVEVKRKAADSLAKIMLECHDLERFVEETVFGVFREQWNLPTPKPGIKPRLNYVGISAITAEQKMDWLKRNVAPTVKHLTKIGLGDIVQEILGITEDVKVM